MQYTPYKYGDQKCKHSSKIFCHKIIGFTNEHLLSINLKLVSESIT